MWGYQMYLMSDVSAELTVIWPLSGGCTLWDKYPHSKGVGIEKSVIKKLNLVEDREQNQLKTSNMFAALENFNDNGNINRDLENVGQRVKIPAEDILGQHELKNHTTWFDEMCWKFRNQKKLFKLLRLQNWIQIIAGSLNNVRGEIIRHCRKKGKILKVKLKNV